MTVSDTVEKVGEFYSADLPNPSSLPAEIHSWHSKWRCVKEEYGYNALPTTLTSTQPKVIAFFPNLKTLLTSTILCTLP